MTYNNVTMIVKNGNMVPNNEPNFSIAYVTAYNKLAFGKAKACVIRWRKEHPTYQGAVNDRFTPIGRIVELAKCIHMSFQHDYKHNNKRFLWQEVLVADRLIKLVENFRADEAEAMKKRCFRPIESYVDTTAEPKWEKQQMASSYNGQGVDFEERSDRTAVRAR